MGVAEQEPRRVLVCVSQALHLVKALHSVRALHLVNAPPSVKTLHSVKVVTFGEGVIFGEGVTLGKTLHWRRPALHSVKAGVAFDKGIALLWGRFVR